jgi:uncharacterized RDD family membrane protein YckC
MQEPRRHTDVAAFAFSGVWLPLNEPGEHRIEAPARAGVLTRIGASVRRALFGATPRRFRTATLSPRVEA